MNQGMGSLPPREGLGTAWGILGQSPAIRHVCEQIETFARSRKNVLVTGETGTGKELVARAIHHASGARSGPFVALNCAALPETLLETELFGHVRGAFTGAHSSKTGYFEAASGGTLFLDEIGEVPLALQSKLLRAIERREIVRVGGTQVTHVDARVIAATNRDLREECAAKRFREDLYFRLAVLELRVPPLRERKEDIPTLLQHLITQASDGRATSIAGVDPPALGALLTHRWPGNVRELENVVHRALAVHKGQRITLADLPRAVFGDTVLPGDPDNLREGVRRYEAEHIRVVLAACGDNHEEAARRMGIDPSTLYRKLKGLARGRTDRAASPPSKTPELSP